MERINKLNLVLLVASLSLCLLILTADHRRGPKTPREYLMDLVPVQAVPGLQAEPEQVQIIVTFGIRDANDQEVARLCCKIVIVDMYLEGVRR